MINDTARLMNDLSVVISVLAPEMNEIKMKMWVEEVLCNYQIEHKTQQNLEDDLQEHINKFLSAKSVKRLSIKTLEGYLIELRLFANHVDKPVVKITKEDINDYLSSKKEWSAGTVDKKLSNIKNFFSWLVNEGYLLKNPAATIDPPVKPKRLPKALSIDELELVRESCETIRERAIIEVMYSTGCRLSEVADMKIKDIIITEKKMKVIGKGDKERIVYLTSKSLYHLRKYLKSRNDDCEYLFVTERKPYRKLSNRTFKDIVDKVHQRTDIEMKITPHVFRHTKATLMRENGADISEIQEVLGHENVSTTLMYARVSEERKQQAHRRYHVQ